MTEKTNLEELQRQLEEEATTELLVKVCEENQTRKILLLMKECTDLDEAEEKIRDLLKEYEK